MDDFDRDIWCLLGLPFDAVTMAQAVARVRAAAASRARCFVSTPNLNFLVAAQSDAAFRESVIDSDLSVADGMPLVWLARVLGVPIRERVAGSDLFEALRRGEGGGTSLSVFFFGGPDGIAAQASDRLNGEGGPLRCVGAYGPGFGTLDEMSTDAVLERVNASGADFLVVALGARKGQAWIVRNLPRLAVPVVSHLGAVVNFVAGSVRRAPARVQRLGLEWLWRIKEEPALWVRYARDGLGLLRLVATRVVPWLVVRALRRNGDALAAAQVRFAGREADGAGGAGRDAEVAMAVVTLRGTLHAARLDPVRAAFRQAATSGTDVTVDLAQVGDVDGAFLGLLMVLRKRVRAVGRHLRVTGASRAVRRSFRLNAADYLLE